MVREDSNTGLLDCESETLATQPHCLPHLHSPPHEGWLSPIPPGSHGPTPPVNLHFTITAEIHARSLANFYGQYADRHMNLKFMRHVSEREPAIRQFVIIKNKLMSVFDASVLLLNMNFVITLSK